MTPVDIAAVAVLAAIAVYTAAGATIAITEYTRQRRARRRADARAWQDTAARLIREDRTR